MMVCKGAVYCMKQLVEFVLPPGWDASMYITGLPQALSLPVPIYTPGRGGAMRE